MENPQKLQVPTDPVERIHALAREIAYGSIIQNKFTPHLRVKNANDQGEFADEGLNEYLKERWGNYHNYYSLHKLVSFGYLVKSKVDFQEEGITFYDVTLKAFELLEKLPTTTNIFISYKQIESSALALLIESRLKHINPDIDIFIDKNIESGNSISSRIQAAIEQSQFFICLLSPNTLKDSQFVKNEIVMAAIKTERIIIPICHNGYKPDDLYDQYFSDNKALVVMPESAEEYETNMTKLLIRLRYSTI